MTRTSVPAAIAALLATASCASCGSSEDAAAAEVLSPDVLDALPDGPEDASPVKECRVRDYGAVGDGQTLDTQAIQDAVDDCAGAGGTVVLDGGTFLSGTVVLKADMTLLIAADAVLLGSTNQEDYTEGHLLYAKDADRLVVEGPGVIDGNGEFWWGARLLNGGWRPHPMIRLVSCDGLTVKGIRLTNSPGWHLHLLDSDNVLVDQVEIKTLVAPTQQSPNTDGIDIDACRHVEVSNCDVETGDDAVVVKNGTEGHVAESFDITVHDCRLSSWANALKIGTRPQADVSDVVFRDCEIHAAEASGKGTRAMGGVTLVSDAGAQVHDVLIENIHMKAVQAPFFFRVQERKLDDGTLTQAGMLSAVTVRNVTVDDASLPSMVMGIPGHPVGDVRFENVSVVSSEGGTKQDAGIHPRERNFEYPDSVYFGKMPAFGLYARHVEGPLVLAPTVAFSSSAKVEERPAVLLEDVQSTDLSGLAEGTEVVTLDTGLEDPGVRMRKDGWLRGDLHIHTPASDGEDSLGTLVGLVEFLQSPVFLASHPEYEGNGIDFLATTDHGTLDALLDPVWAATDSLILVPGQEIGGGGHANAWGISTAVTHAGGPPETFLQGWQETLDAVHAQGGLFSMNHPYSGKGLNFGADLRDHDAVEVWNTAWALMAAAFTPENLADWEAAHGPASPAFKKGVELQDAGGSQQALRMVEAQLALGSHPALVGGSDRHAFFVPGFPTTWVRAESADVAGILAGIAARHTFVARTPAAATIELAVETPLPGSDRGDVQTHEIGDLVPVACNGKSTTARFQLRVGRADNGLVRLVSGPALAEEDLPAAGLSKVVFESTVEGDDFRVTVDLDMHPGDWLYPMVLEPLVVPGLPPDKAKLLPKMAEGAMKTGAEDFDALATIFWDIIDFAVVLAPEDCDPSKWDPYMLQCMPPDATGIATFFVPDWVSRGINVLLLDGKTTDWTVGAVGSAVRFSPCAD